MIIVLDTSAAIEIVIQREHSADLGRNIAEADCVITPTLFIPEITNVDLEPYRKEGSTYWTVSL